MTTLEQRMKDYNCPWLADYLKDLLRNKELRKYNRVKLTLYYFPRILRDISKDMFDSAISDPSESYISISNINGIYKRVMEFCEDKRGCDFSASVYGVNPLLRLIDVYEYFER